MDTFDIFFITWMSLGVAIVIASIILAGFYETSSYEREKVIESGFLIGAIWPFAIIMALVYLLFKLPVFLLLKLGEWLRSKIDKPSNNDI